MTAKNLLDRIEEGYSSFSKGQRRIASYIMEHNDKAAFMTASRLGQTVGVSESTVVRFAMELGFEGYPQLQRAMQEMIRGRLTSLQRIEVTDSRMKDGDILQNVLGFDIDKIKYTLDHTSRETFASAVQAIAKARRVYLVGVRSAEALAVFLNYYFNMILDNTVFVRASSETAMFEQMLRVNEEDVVIGISFPRYSKRVVSAMRFAGDKNARVIAITDSVTSPLAQIAGDVLLARSDMASFVDSLVAPLSLINALIVAVAMDKKDEVREAFGQLEHIWEKYGVYEKVDKKEP